MSIEEATGLIDEARRGTRGRGIHGYCKQYDCSLFLSVSLVGGGGLVFRDRHILCYHRKPLS